MRTGTIIVPPPIPNMPATKPTNIPKNENIINPSIMIKFFAKGGTKAI